MRKIDMTTGNPAKKIMLFSLPILIGNIFQQLYSLSDTLVVGQFLGKEALAAVGASSALVILIQSIIFGLCMGSSVLFARLHASKDTVNLSKSISTAFIFIMSFSVVLSLLLFLLLNPILRLFQIPSDAFSEARDYLRIVIIGLPFYSLYNMGASLLRSTGDSKTPLYFLIVSTLINIVLDFILVIYTPLGVKGPALSTLLAYVLSSLPLLWIMKKEFKHLKLKLVFDVLLFKTIWSYAFLTSLQQSIMNFGILMVQGLVNSFGVLVMAAFAIGVKIDQFAYMPLQDFGNAFSIYVSQNKGVKQYKRIHQGFKSALLISSVFSSLITGLVFIFSKDLIHIFTNDNEVISIGITYLRTEGLFYFLIGYLFIFYGLYRGLGKMSTSIVLTVTSLGLRVLIAYLLVFILKDYKAIWFSIPIGWFLADLLGFVIYEKNKLSLQNELNEGLAY